jgi:hypothetical protein
METHKFQELPNLTDPDLIRSSVAVQGLRGSLAGLVCHVVDQLSQAPVTIPTRVSLAIANRVSECSLSTEILCSKNRARDAAILLLSVIELRLDIQYIAIDLSRSDIWIDHARENKKPWRVRTQLEEIHPEPKEREAEISLYRQYSMVKHANPVAKEFAFPLSAARHELTIDTNQENSHWIRVHLFGLGSCLCRTGIAAAAIFASEGLDVGTFVEEFHAGERLLSQYNEEHLLATLRSVHESQYGE